VTAAAQTKSNIDTATAQTNLNQVDQSTPTGTLKYTVVGKNPDGTPHYQATTAYSPGAQTLFDTGMQTQQNLATLGKSQSEKLSGLLSAPLDLSNDATETRLNELAHKRLDPQLAQQQTALETKLSNQGIKLGSSAYDRATMDLAQQQNDARNSLLLSGHNQAVQEALTSRQEPINEIIGLTSGTQLATPQFANTPQTSVAGTDTAGLATNAYNQQYQQWLQAQNQNQSLLGGLFGLGSAAIMASDRRLKTAIRQIGQWFNGLPVYEFRYHGDTETHWGFMADDVERLKPAAIAWHPDGYARVNYSLAEAA
jgi:hypothetical protein